MKSDKVRDKKTFYRRIAENPGDDGLRLIFADWLEDIEQGPRTEAELARCEFIREQCKHNGAGQTPDRALELYKQYGREWYGDDVTYGDVPVFFDYASYNRGFLRFYWPGTSRMSPLEMERIAQPDATEINLCNTSFHAGQALDIIAMGRWQNMQNLAVLNLSCNALHENQAAGIRAMGQWRNMPNLTAIDLSHNCLHYNLAAGIRAMGEWRNMPNLAVLDLSHNHLHAEEGDSIRAMGEWRNMLKLTTLNLSSNYLHLDQAAGIRAIGGWKRENVPNLAAIDLSGNNLYADQAAGIRAMGEWENMPHLTALCLSANYLYENREESIRAMAEWRNMQALRRLDLQENGLKRADQVQPLCDAIRAGHFHSIERVQVDDNYFAKEKSPAQTALNAAIAEWRGEPSPEVTGNARGNAGMEREL